MKFRPTALFACAILATTLAACTKDPTSSGSGVAETIVLNRSTTNRSVGEKFSIIAYSVDKNIQRMAGKLDATSAGPAIVIDSVIYLPELLETRVFLNAAAKSASGTFITVSGHGLSADVKVVVS